MRPIKNNKILSTNRRYMILSVILIFIPLKFSDELTSNMDLLNLLDTHKNIRGDKGKPYLISLPYLKNLDAIPFIKNEMKLM